MLMSVILMPQILSTSILRMPETGDARPAGPLRRVPANAQQVLASQLRSVPFHVVCTRQLGGGELMRDPPGLGPVARDKPPAELLQMRGRVLLDQGRVLFVTRPYGLGGECGGSAS